MLENMQRARAASARARIGPRCAWQKTTKQKRVVFKLSHYMRPESKVQCVDRF